MKERKYGVDITCLKEVVRFYKIDLTPTIKPTLKDIEREKYKNKLWYFNIKLIHDEKQIEEKLHIQM